MTMPTTNQPLSDEEFFKQFPESKKKSSFRDVVKQIPFGISEGLERFGRFAGSVPGLAPGPFNSLPQLQGPVLDNLVRENTTIDPTPETPAGRIARETIASGVEGIPFGLATGGVSGLGSLAAGGAADQALQEIGAPNWLSTAARVITSLNPVKILRDIVKGSSSATYTSSGLPYRNFQLQNKPYNAPRETVKNINRTLEQDFKNISDSILEKSRTVRAINEFPEFAETISKEIDNVKNIAKNIPETFSTRGLSRQLAREAESKVGKNITPNEYQKSYKKFYNDIQKEISTEPYIKNKKLVYPEPLDISAEKLVKQYRDNNKALGRYFESGQSGAYNDGKRDALLDYNRAIEKVIQKRYPNSEFSKLFRFTNDRWAEIKSYDSVQNVLNDTFSGDKINFNVLEKAMNSPNFTRNIERLVGKEGVNNFKDLSRDFLTRNQTYQLIKQAENQGFKAKELLSVLAFIKNPKIGGVIAGLSVGSNIYRRIFQKGLSDPAYFRDWKKGLKLFKQGKYPQAVPIFNRLFNEAKEPEAREVSVEEFLAP